MLWHSIDYLIDFCFFLNENSYLFFIRACLCKCHECSYKRLMIFSFFTYFCSIAKIWLTLHIFKTWLHTVIKCLSEILTVGNGSCLKLPPLLFVAHNFYKKGNFESFSWWWHRRPALCFVFIYTWCHWLLRLSWNLPLTESLVICQNFINFLTFTDFNWKS